MYSKQKLLEMITSQKASVRYDACEWMRVSRESSPEMVKALDRATYDLDKQVAERARYALQADVHHQMAIKLGIIKPEERLTSHSVPYQNVIRANNKPGADDDPEKTVVLGLIGLIFAFIGVVFMVNSFSTQGLINRSKTWPATTGEVIASDITYVPASEWADDGYQLKITYRYTVTGTTYKCMMRLSEQPTKTLAIKVQQTFAVGSQIKINYDPANPRECVSLYDEVPTGTWVVSTVFIIFGFVMIAGIIASLVKKTNSGYNQ